MAEKVVQAKPAQVEDKPLVAPVSPTPVLDALTASDEKVLDIRLLDPELEVAGRTGNDAPADSRFHRVFVIPSRDWSESADNGDLHRANCVATLQEALHRALHPRGEARFDGADALPGKSTALKYSVEVILASLDEAPEETYTPRVALDDMGGSTMQVAQSGN